MNIHYRTGNMNIHYRTGNRKMNPLKHTAETCSYTVEDIGKVIPASRKGQEQGHLVEDKE